MLLRNHSYSRPTQEFALHFSEDAMSLRSICRTLTVALLAWGMLPLAAQTTGAGQSSTDNQFAQPTSSGSAAQGGGYAGERKPAKWEFFAGYSWLNLDQSIAGTKAGFPVTFQLKDARGGFMVDGSYFFNKWFGLTVDSGGHFGDTYDFA